MNLQAIIFTGIQGSGKSTFYKDSFFSTHVRISLDLLKTRRRELRFIQTCLETGANFVIDNTNITAEHRRKYIDISKGAEYEIIGYFFESDLDSALSRNRLRQGKERIPEAGVRAMYTKLEIPKKEEGFDMLYKVRIGNEGWSVEEIG